MGIKHDDVKATGEKGFASEWNKNHIVDGDIPMDQNQLLDNVIENRTDFPAGPVEGQQVYRTDLNAFFIYNGADWDDFTPQIYTAGEGIDVVANVISGEDATTANKGIARFNSNDFSVSSGEVSLKNKTRYWSIVGAVFHPDSESESFGRNTAGYIDADSDGNFMHAQVNLPHGAVVTAVIVYGAGAGETWSLKRHQTNTKTTNSTLASAALGTTDSSIANATIDNINYGYWLVTSSLDTGDEVWGARITYTTDYD